MQKMQKVQKVQKVVDVRGMRGSKTTTTRAVATRAVSSRAVPARRTTTRTTTRRIVASRAKEKVDADADADEAWTTCSTESFAFEGTRRLYGEEGFEALRAAHVVVVGLGGVGSWAVEALARSGVGALTLCDLDDVCETNINRQVVALRSTVGKMKADVMAARVLDVNPDCEVRVVRDFVQGHNVEEILRSGAGAERFGGDKGDAEWRRPDYVLDAIDKESDKASIVAFCTRERIPLCVTGGAGGLDNLTGLRVEDLANTTFNRLLSMTRKTLRKEYNFPKEGNTGMFPGSNKGKRKAASKWGIKCVYAPENENVFKKAGTKGRGGIGCDGVGGSAVFVTGAIGFQAASEISLDLIRGKHKKTDGPAETGWRSKVWPKMTAASVASTTKSASVPTENEGKKGDEAVGNDSNIAQDGDKNALEQDTSRGELKATAASLRDAQTLDAREIFDAHCHWHLDGEHAVVRALCSRLAGAAMTTTRPGDWPAATAVREGDDDLQVNVPIAFGVHPWWAHLEKNDKDEWMAKLKATVESTPNCVVGEIGLDKVAVPPDADADYPNQLDCFRRQLDLATELRRPVVVHSVKATGDMTEIFRTAEALPPKIFMHSFGGSEEFLRQLTKMKKYGDRFYFGFSSVINLRSPKTQSVIRTVPNDKLLLESDLCDPTRAEDELRVMLAIIADIKGWSVRDAARITRENAERFFS